MNTNTYTIQFIGGPSDGLILSEPGFRMDEKVRMPASPDLPPCIDAQTDERVCQWCTTYRLTALPTSRDFKLPIHLRYDFVGFELLDTSDSSEVASRPRPHGLSALATWIRNVRHRIANWMLAPVDYPLKCV